MKTGCAYSEWREQANGPTASGWFASYWCIGTADRVVLDDGIRRFPKYSELPIPSSRRLNALGCRMHQ